MALCVECMGEATIQVVSEVGAPLFTLCGPCHQARQKFAKAIMAMLDDARAKFAEQAAEQEVAGFKPTGLLPGPPPEIICRKIFGP